MRTEAETLQGLSDTLAVANRQNCVRVMLDACGQVLTETRGRDELTEVRFDS